MPFPTSTQSELGLWQVRSNPNKKPILPHCSSTEAQVIRQLPPPSKRVGSPPRSDLRKLSTPSPDPEGGTPVPADCQGGGQESCGEPPVSQGNSKTSPLASPEVEEAKLARNAPSARELIIVLKNDDTTSPQSELKPSKIDARAEWTTGKWGTAFDIMRDVLYGYRQYLDLYEQTTLSFIFARTGFYNKEWEYIPLRHFLKGVWSKKSGCIISRIRISEKKLIDSLRHLERKGIIDARRSVTRAKCYRIRRFKEIKLRDVVEEVIGTQSELFDSIIQEMELNESKLSDENKCLLAALKTHRDEQKLPLQGT
jgi:hypothetical protein